MGGQVQMIYFDPPYGVKFGSNFQPFVRKRDVKHGADDAMIREPEMVKAYRDTWELGLHSYLTYLRDRLLAHRLAHAILVLMEEAVGRGWAAFSQSEAQRRGVEWLDLARSPAMNKRLADLVAAFARERYRPDALKSLVSAEDARKRWDALAKFYQERGHFLVTNGPYQLKAWSADSVKPPEWIERCRGKPRSCSIKGDSSTFSGSIPSAFERSRRHERDR